MSIFVYLIAIIICALIAGFCLGGLIFGKDVDGKMYFYTDAMDGKEYTFAEFDAQNVSEIHDKKTITLKCVKLPEDFDITSLSH